MLRTSQVSIWRSDILLRVHDKGLMWGRWGFFWDGWVLGGKGTARPDTQSWVDEVKGGEGCYGVDAHPISISAFLFRTIVLRQREVIRESAICFICHLCQNFYPRTKAQKSTTGPGSLAPRMQASLQLRTTRPISH